MIVGLIMLRTGDAVVGQTIVLAFCAYMVVASLTMGLADLLGYYPRRGDSLLGTVASSGPPLLALVAAAL